VQSHSHRRSCTEAREHLGGTARDIQRPALNQDGPPFVLVQDLLDQLKPALAITLQLAGPPRGTCATGVAISGKFLASTTSWRTASVAYPWPHRKGTTA
jgi:hypothetical protein